MAKKLGEYKNFNTRIFVLLLLGLIFLGLLPFFINPESLTKRNGDWSEFVWSDYYLFKQSFWQYHQIPLWNPLVFSGVPEIANPQTPITYPPNYLTLFVPIDYGIVLLIFLHIFIAGFFAYKMGRDFFKWEEIPSIVLALGISFSPFLWSKFSVGHLSMGIAMTLVSPIVYFTVCFIKSSKLRYLFWLVLILSFQYCNYPTIWYYTSFFGLITLLALFIKGRNRKLLPLFLAAPLSLLLIFPVFMAQIQAGSWITRTELQISDTAIPIWSITRFFKSIITPSNFLGDLETEVWLYPSLVLIGVAIYGFSKLVRSFKLITLGILVLVILLTLGSRTPVFGLFTSYVPGFSYLRVVTRDWFVFTTILAILGAYGFTFLKGKLKYGLFILVLVDLIFFSIFRIWSIPSIMKPGYLNIFSSFLQGSSDYRYYCTSRCLSAKNTTPLNVRSADGYHLLILKNYNKKISEAGGFDPPKYTGNIPGYEQAEAQPKAEKLGKFAVRWVISRNNLLDPNFIPVKKELEYTLYENKLVKPRIRFKELANNQIKLIEDRPNNIKVQTSGEKGNLILADPFYPGWLATVDGNPTIINLEDGWARRIFIPEGEHIIEFSFKPLLNF